MPLAGAPWLQSLRPPRVVLQPPRVADVLPQGPADVAGIRAGDVVVSVDGHPTPSLISFTASLYQHPPDQVVRIDALRGDQRLSFRVASVMARKRRAFRPFSASTARRSR